MLIRFVFCWINERLRARRCIHTIGLAQMAEGRGVGGAVRRRRRTLSGTMHLSSPQLPSEEKREAARDGENRNSERGKVQKKTGKSKM